MILFPFGFHIPVVVATVVFMFLIDGRQFFPGSSRTIYAARADGTPYRQPGNVVLQTDIVTIINMFASLSRITGTWEAAGILWRCSFLFMEKGGISLKGVKRILTGMPLYPKDVTLQRHSIVFLLLLMANYILGGASLVLSGSITWNPALDFVTSDRPLVGVPHNLPGLSLQDYRQNPDMVHTVVATSAAMADVTWGTLGTNSTWMTRVLQTVNFLSNGSTIQNITVPFFSVDNFEWIKDPNSTLTPQQQALVFSSTPYSPYVTAGGWLGLIPDVAWGPLTTGNTSMPEPLVVSETRILSLRLNDAQPGQCNNAEESIPSDVGRYRHLNGTREECFAFAKVIYRAGVALCADCLLTAPAVIQSPHTLTLAPDSLTAEALAIAPYVGMNLMATGWAFPPPDRFPKMQDSAVEFLSRSYQATWNSLTDTFGEKGLATNLRLSVLTTQASVMKWRVWLWVLLHLFSIAARLFFYADHRSTRYPWLDSPAFAALFLDTEALRDECDSWKPDENLPNVMLKLENGDNRRRRIVVDVGSKV